MSWLFSLPLIDAIAVLSLWCELKDLMILDSAFCNKTEQIELKNWFQHSAFVMDGGRGLNELTFATNHKIKLKSMKIMVVRHTERYGHVFKNCDFSKLESLKTYRLEFLHSAFEAFIHMMDNCTSFKSLSLMGCDASRLFIIVNPQLLSNLTSLQCHRTEINATAMKILHLHCRNLINLDLRLCGIYDTLSLAINNRQTLKKLSFEGKTTFFELNDVVLLHLSYCTKLESLTIVVSTVRYTQDGVMSLADSCINLISPTVMLGDKTIELWGEMASISNAAKLA